MIAFSQTISKLGINPLVNVPAGVLKELFKKAGKETGPIPVLGTLNGNKFTQTVVKYQGKWRLYLNGPMLKGAQIGVGDKARVTISYDPRSRKVAMHPLLQKALSGAKNKKIKAAFESLAPYRQKEILRYLHGNKSEETLKRNVAKVVAHLSGEKVEGLLALTYRSQKGKI